MTSESGKPSGRADPAARDAAFDAVTEREVNPAAQASTRAFRPAPLHRDEHEEDPLTRMLEQQGARIPSHWFLFAGVGTMALSVGLELAGRHQASRFTGMWAPALLVAGVYNKLVKSLGPR